MTVNIKLVKIILPTSTMFLTNHHHDIMIAQDVYHASLLVDDIVIKSNASLQADTAIISFISQSHKQFNGARLEIYDYDLQTHNISSVVCFIGHVVATDNYDFMVTLKAFSSKRLLNRVITRNYGYQCQAQWGDNRCKIDKEIYKQQIQITEIIRSIVYYEVLDGQVDNFYAPYLQDSLGNIIHTHKLNATEQHFLIEPFYFIKVNEIYNLYAGCTKNSINCNNYSNFENYFGFT